MIISSSNTTNSSESCNLRWCTTSSISNLTIGTTSPTPNRTICFNSTSKKTSRRYTTYATHSYSRHGQCLINTCTVSNLSRVIISPTPDCIVVFDGTCVDTSSRRGRYRYSSGHARKSGYMTLSCCTIAECTITIVSPTPNISIVFKGTRLSGSSSYSSDVCESTRLYGY